MNIISDKEENLIIWQKWFDPFGGDEEQNIDMSATIRHTNQLDDEEPYNEEIEDNHINTKSVRAIATPMGLIPYTENTASSKIFNFWTGHTNFSITKTVADIIEYADGVETLDVFTRYRFRISIGRAFDASKIMKQINDKVYTYLKTGNIWSLT